MYYLLSAYRSGESLSPVGGRIYGKLLTTQTTVIVDITLTTHWSGRQNTTQHLQSVIVVMMEDIESNIKVWLDDCLLHTKTEDDLLATLNFLLKQCREHGLKLHASKCVLFATTVQYFVRLITKDGVRFDPNNMEALQTMQEPQNGADSMSRQ
jgi:Reverse transcriptase (RNA-dependent DNA polymerase)